MIFRLAEPSDDNPLRTLMREIVVPGHIQIAYTREPNFFNAYQDVDPSAQVIVAEENHRILGVACRSVRQLMVNGKPRALGYLSGLRIRPSARKGTALARGYAYLKTLHADGQVPAYLTTIVQGNEEARRILTSQRATLPTYHPLGNYLTYVCPVKRRPLTAKPLKDVEITTAEKFPLQALTEYLRQEGSARQFFPVFTPKGEPNSLLRSIGLEHILVAQQAGKIVGTLAVWDQEKAKQHLVAGYSGLFQIVRPLLNLVLRTLNYHTLPRVSETVRTASVALLCIRNNDNKVFHALLQHALALAAAKGLHHLALGLHERDPFIPNLKNVFHITYCSGLYLVEWEGKDFYAHLDPSLVPYLELGTL
jgi:hypothetical protein